MDAGYVEPVRNGLFSVVVYDEVPERDAGERGALSRKFAEALTFPLLQEGSFCLLVPSVGKIAKKAFFKPGFELEVDNLLDGILEGGSVEEGGEIELDEAASKHIPQEAVIAIEEEKDFLTFQSGKGFPFLFRPDAVQVDVGLCMI